MPSNDPRRSRDGIKNQRELFVKMGATSSVARSRTTIVNIIVPGFLQLEFSFSGEGDFKIGAMQLPLPGIGAPPYQPDSQVLHFAQDPSGPTIDTRSPEDRILQFDREKYRVAAYAPEYASRSYPSRKWV